MTSPFLSLETLSHSQVMSPDFALTTGSNSNCISSPIMLESANAVTSMTTSTSHVCYTKDVIRIPMLASNGQNWIT